MPDENEHKGTRSEDNDAENELPDSTTSRAVHWSMSVTKPKIPYYGIAYHF
jgi:hypothetical protein